MKKRVWMTVLITLTLCVLSGCVKMPVEEADTSALSPLPVTVAQKSDISQLSLTDDESLYEAYDPLKVVCFYITVREGNAADQTDHTFAEVNSYLNLQGMTNVQKIKTEAIVRVGDETGPLPGELGYTATRANATINVRGRTSTGYPQKSYRLTLYDSAGTWRGQSAIALNKHPSDSTRLRNMLYFDLLRDVPGMTSLRTQFVHVYIKDETDPAAPDAYVDYGLFTQVELPNNRYLKNHGLSRDGNLYKAQMCELKRYPEAIRLITDPAYDEAAFSAVLEPKTTDDHAKLIRMLDAVNDYTIPIERVVETYFDLDNLTSYVAFNILMANPDSNAQNYLLYSPVNSEKWYYLCWDGDAALSYYEDELVKNAWADADWARGVSDYWGVTLFNRMLRVAAYRDALTEKVEYLHTIITPERIDYMIDQYRTVVDQYTRVMPDVINLRVTLAQLESIYENMTGDTDRAYRYYINSLKQPMPFFLGDAASEDGLLVLSFDPAYDFGGEFVRYDVQVATDWSFNPESVVYESLGQLTTSVTLPLPEAGEYFWRAVATNESGYTQISFDQVETSSGSHGGMRVFSVSAEGTVVN